MKVKRLFISSLQSKERPYFGSAVAWFKLHAHFPLNVKRERFESCLIFDILIFFNELDKIATVCQYKYITKIGLHNLSHFHCLQVCLLSH